MLSFAEKSTETVFLSACTMRRVVLVVLVGPCDVGNSHMGTLARPIDMEIVFHMWCTRRQVL